MELISTSEFIIELTEDISDFVMSCTVQFFKNNSIDSTIPLGTGVLFTFKERIFIITAAHNLENETKSDIYYRCGDEHISLEYDSVVSSKLTNSSKVDTAIIEIRTKDAINDLLINFQPIKLEHINMNYPQLMSDDLRVSNLDYYMGGYPASQTNLEYKQVNKWKSKFLFYSCGLTKKNLQPLKNLGFNEHIFCTFMKNGIDVYEAKKLKLPKLNGMSGCGLWINQGLELKTGQSKPKLVGIFYGIEKGVMIFTRIDFAIEILRQKFKLGTIAKSPLNIKWK